MFSIHCKFFCRLALGVLIAAASQSFLSCAKEVSEEDRQREEHQRESKRLESAQGIYTGLLYTANSSHGIPASIEITPLSNANVDGDLKPKLGVSMQLGLFGGITLTANNAAFDFGKQRIDATFEKAPGIEGLEFTATSEGSCIKNVVLKGSRTGSFVATLCRDQLNLLSEDPSFYYNIGMEEIQNGLLVISRRSGVREAPQNSDLSALPFLEASIVFDHFAATPQIASNVLYDPLTGRMQINFNSNVIIIDHLFLSESPTSNDVPSMQAYYAVGDIKSGYFKLERATKGRLEQLEHLPPQDMHGIYRVSSNENAKSFKVKAEIKYLNTSKNNGSEHLFTSFPLLRLRVTPCEYLGGKPSVYLSESVDYLTKTIRFVSDDQSEVRLAYSPNWASATGLFLSPENPGSGLATPQLRLSEGDTECRN